MPAITEEQIKQLTDSIMGIKTATEEAAKKSGEKIADLDKKLEKIADLEKSAEQLRKEFDDEKKLRLSLAYRQRNLRPGQAVTDECAEWIACLFIKANHENGRLKIIGTDAKEKILKRVNDVIGRHLGDLAAEQRSTLTTADIPMPTDFGSEVVELVWKYGQARQYGTVYPLGTGTTKLPKLTTSPAFGLISAAGSVAEKSPQFAFVTFNAEKWGGIVRYPSEIDADSIVALGQFIARYIGREMAKIEDTVFWAADGTGTYDSLNGLLKGSGNILTLASTNTSPDKITLANLRALRAKVGSAALPTSAYYMNATMEGLLCTFNTSSTVTPYIANGANNGATLDGFPIRWVDVLPPYTTSATVNAYQVGFGDASYHYLGVRQGMMVDTSRDVYFATDEQAIRALERFTTGLMASNAFGALQLAAS